MSKRFMDTQFEELDDHLLNDERCTQDLREVIVEDLYDKRQEFPKAEIWLIENEEGLGYIIDVYVNGKNVYSATYWFDDYLD